MNLRKINTDQLPPCQEARHTARPSGDVVAPANTNMPTTPYTYASTSHKYSSGHVFFSTRTIADT